jgi:hypothetical protein
MLWKNRDQIVSHSCCHPVVGRRSFAMHWKNVQDPHTGAVRIGTFARTYHATHRFARGGVFEVSER